MGKKTYLYTLNYLIVARPVSVLMPHCTPTQHGYWVFGSCLSIGSC